METTRIYVDFNTMMTDPKRRVYIGSMDSDQNDRDLLTFLVPGTIVVLYDEEMQVRATSEFDRFARVWLGVPDWSTCQLLHEHLDIAQ